MTDCAAFAALLADHAEDQASLARHLGACGDCRATAGVLDLVRRVRDDQAPDLWPRLRARLAHQDADFVVLRFPRFTWQAAAALAAALVTVLLPGDLRLIALVLGAL
jgi:hypothetical protein